MRLLGRETQESLIADLDAAAALADSGSTAISILELRQVSKSYGQASLDTRSTLPQLVHPIW